MQKTGNSGKTDTPAECRTSLLWHVMQLERFLAVGCDAALREHGLTLRGYSALVALEHGECPSQLDLAESCGIDKSSLVAVLDQLEQGGWVERVAAPHDRRARVVRSTPKGQAVLVAAHDSVRAAERKAVAELPEALRKGLTGALGSSPPRGPGAP